jgi:hypothetical protein
MSHLQQAVGRNPSIDSLPPAPENLQVTNDSPALPHRSIPGRPGVGSRVTMGYFDREGVDRLRRTLTHLSETQHAEPEQVGSSETLSVPTTGPFDFEKTLRTIMKRFVNLTTLTNVRGSLN